MGPYSSATHLVGPCHVLNVQSVIFKLQFNQLQSQRFAQVFHRPPFVTGSFLTWAGRECFRRDHLFRNSPDSFRLLYHEGCGGREKAETKVSPDQNCCVLFWFYITVFVIAGQSKEKCLLFWALALKSESRCEQNISVFPHHYLHSCRGEGGGVSGKSWLFVWRGELF